MNALFEKSKVVLLLSFLLLSLPGFASEDPIPGVDVIVEKIPPGLVIGRLRTDRRGMILLNGNFEKGHYVVSNKGNTERANIFHRGGVISWQLVQSKNPSSSWKLISK